MPPRRARTSDRRRALRPGPRWVVSLDHGDLCATRSTSTTPDPTGLSRLLPPIRLRPSLVQRTGSACVAEGPRRREGGAVGVCAGLTTLTGRFLTALDAVILSLGRTSVRSDDTRASAVLVAPQRIAEVQIGTRRCAQRRGRADHRPARLGQSLGGTPRPRWCCCARYRAGSLRSNGPGHDTAAWRSSCRMSRPRRRLMAVTGVSGPRGCCFASR